MSSEVAIELKAYDEASAVVENLGATMSSTFSNVEEQTQNLANTTSEASGQISSSYGQVEDATSSLGATQEESQGSFGTQVLAMNNVALAGTNLFMSFERVQNAQVQVDRANLMVQRSTEAVEQAQTTYNDAVAKYGPASTQAKEAADKLAIAQQALQVAHERADMSARNYNNTMLMSAVTVIPSLISIIGTVSHAQEIWTGIQKAGAAITSFFTGATEAQTAATEEATGAQWGLDAALDANPIGIIILAIAGLVAAFIAAYTYCKPFRDAVNELGAALGGALTFTVKTISAELTFMWQNVFVPIGSFLSTVFTDNIKILGTVILWLWNDCFKPFIDNLTWMWDNILKPLAKFIENTFGGALKAVGSIISGVSGTLGGLTHALQGLCFVHAAPAAMEFNNRLADSIKLADTLGGKLGGLSSGLHGVASGIAAESPLSSSVIGGAASAKGTVINNYGPLVQVQGSADKATAQLAASMVKESLQNVVVEPTSTGHLTRKRIRVQ